VATLFALHNGLELQAEDVINNGVRALTMVLPRLLSLLTLAACTRELTVWRFGAFEAREILFKSLGYVEEGLLGAVLLPGGELAVFAGEGGDEGAGADGG
jgi:hypothetical protein